MCGDLEIPYLSQVIFNKNHLQEILQQVLLDQKNFSKRLNISLVLTMFKDSFCKTINICIYITNINI